MEISSEYFFEYVKWVIEMKKKVLTLILLISVIVLSSTNIYGFSLNDVDGTNLPGSAQTSVDKFGQGIISIIATVGSIISVIVLVALGIKYMMGSTEEKAEYKKTLLPYIIGACILFGASSIAGIIYNIAINL